MLPTAPRALTQQAYETELAMEGAVIEASAGRVESGQSEAVPLLPVEPDTGYGVRVRYWASRCTADGTVQPSGWSSWLNFTTGLPSGCVLAPLLPLPLISSLKLAAKSVLVVLRADWSGAVWLTQGAGVEPPVCAGCTNPSSCCDPAVQLRTVFDVAGSHPQALERAQLFVASRGYYKCWLNGVLASDHAQGHATTFEVRTLYDTFDVLALLREGSNGLGCSVARGWFGEGGGMGTMMNNTETRPKSLILKLSLRYKNGTRVPCPVQGICNIHTDGYFQTNSACKYGAGSGGLFCGWPLDFYHLWPVTTPHTNVY